MTGNRVEELEAKVRSLEATVDGLTDELVECKERIQHLEAEIEPEPNGSDIMAPEPTGGQPGMDGTTSQEPAGEEAALADEAKDEASEDANEDSASDDIIVA
ncbi:hypothetical protein BRC89_00255 [Halobacteriales archaeon QS_4_70_19]|nr:MAG: hypothetical protein BRC89_00255 [Halobacteriales archaeon QS_4_70_19]